MDVQEYILGFGTMGEFGRFRPTTPLSCHRGDRVVVRSYRCLELAEVLCDATPGHAHFLPNTTLGKLLRIASQEDLGKADRMRVQGLALIQTASELVHQLDLPLELLDAEVSLDGKQAFLHHFSWGDYDERELVSRLSGPYDLQVSLHRVTTESTTEEEHGCGRPDCGKSDGGCSTCGSGGGCGSCGSSAPADMTAYFADLRAKMMAEHRTPLN